MSEKWRNRFRLSKEAANNQFVTGWYGRGYLPHFDSDGLTQFVTFRLADSLPQKVYYKWQTELAGIQDDEERLLEIAKKIERWLDRGYGECWLRDEKIAELVQNALWHFDTQRYVLHAWCIMPNHVHALLSLLEGWTLDKITHSWKSYTAHQSNKLLNRKGDFWQEESYDRFIRNHGHYLDVERYIEENPVKAGLCQSPEEWKWSSAHYK